MHHVIRSSSRRSFTASATAMAASAIMFGTLAVPATAMPAAAASAPCSTAWGTGAKGVASVTMTRAPITATRAGRHACFDRIVIDVRGDVARRGINASYVPQVYQDGSGDVVPLRGGAKLHVTIGNVVYDASGTMVYSPKNPDELVSTRGFRSLRQVALAGSFEGVTTLGVGVARRTPFRLFLIHGAHDRVVLDIAHR